MTAAERQAELDYIYLERLGMRCDNRQPTERDKREARDEAERQIERIEMQEWKDKQK